jgi:hypothetical protein
MQLSTGIYNSFKDVSFWDGNLRSCLKTLDSVANGDRHYSPARIAGSAAKGNRSLEGRATMCLFVAPQATELFVKINPEILAGL